MICSRPAAYIPARIIIPSIMYSFSFSDCNELPFRISSDKSFQSPLRVAQVSDMLLLWHCLSLGKSWDKPTESRTDHSWAGPGSKHIIPVTQYNTQQNEAVVCERWSGIVEETEHWRVNQRLDHYRYDLLYPWISSKGGCSCLMMHSPLSNVTYLEKRISEQQCCIV